MDEGSGSTVVDETGNNHTLTFGSDTSAPNWDAVNFPPTSQSGNKSLLFDGADDSASTPSHSDFNFSSAYTIEAWIKANVTQLTDSAIVSKWTNSQGFLMQLDSSGKIINYIDGSGSNAGITDLRDDNWHHAAVVWDNGQRFVYVDGVLEASGGSASAPTFTDTPLFIGKYLIAEPRNFQGNIDEVKIWNVVRTEEQIREDAGISLVVVLNELMPKPSDKQDWVEIYNAGNINVDISGWKLRDSTGIFETFPSGTVLSAGSYTIVTESERLNNGGDTITLLDSGDNTVDAKSYTSADVQENISIGRNPNGTGAWQNCNVPSQNSSNNGSC